MLDAQRMISLATMISSMIDGAEELAPFSPCTLRQRDMLPPRRPFERGRYAHLRAMRKYGFAEDFRAMSLKQLLPS